MDLGRDESNPAQDEGLAQEEWALIAPDDMVEDGSHGSEERGLVNHGKVRTCSSKGSVAVL
jgi:hypothetical protein